jgi:hypothetical protein
VAAPPGTAGALGAAPAGAAQGNGAVDRGAGQDQQQQRARGGRSRTAPRGRGAHAQRPASSASATPAAAADDAAPPVIAPGLQRPKRPSRLQYTAPSADEPGQVEQRSSASGSDDFSRVGRNDLCPCGSGRKYKRCHGDPRNRADA